RALTPSEAAEIATPDRIELAKHFAARAQRLYDLVSNRVKRWRQRLDEIADRRVFRRPLETARELERKLDDIHQRMGLAFRGRLELGEAKLGALAGKLESLSPLNVLSRGYSLTRIPGSKKIVRTVDDVAIGEVVEILISDGQLTAKVESAQRTSDD